VDEPKDSRSYLPPEEPLYRDSVLAVASLGLGFASWIILPLLAAIPAVVFGHMARLEIARSEGRLTGDGMAVAGLIMGYANIACAALAIVCMASLFLLPAVLKFFSG
jgi:hypothetical protein